jgi:hypothetical protein
MSYFLLFCHVLFYLGCLPRTSSHPVTGSARVLLSLQGTLFPITAQLGTHRRWRDRCKRTSRPTGTTGAAVCEALVEQNSLLSKVRQMEAHKAVHEYMGSAGVPGMKAPTQGRCMPHNRIAFFSCLDQNRVLPTSPPYDPQVTSIVRNCIPRTRPIRC